MDPRKSKIDIVQAAGRAMRIKKNNKIGYILVPIITNSNDIKLVSNDTQFENLISIITSLSTQDQRLVEEIKNFNINKSKKSKTKIINFTTNFLKKIEINKFEKSIHIKLWKNIRNLNFKPYKYAKNYALSLNFSNIDEWKEHTKNENFPLDIPVNPNQTYKDKGWISYGDFLGTNRIANQFKKFVTYKDLKNSINGKFKSKGEWFEFTQDAKFPRNYPTSPPHQYKNEWISWPDFLGYKKPNYEKAKALIRPYKFKKAHEFIKFIQNTLNLKFQ